MSRDWRDQANCKGMGDAYFPTRSSGYGEAHKLSAETCAQCPVREPCEAEGLAMASFLGGALYGRWGGKTAKELNAMARSRGERPEFTLPDLHALWISSARKPADGCIDCGEPLRRNQTERCRACRGAHVAEGRSV